MMTKQELTAAILTAKARQKLTWAAIAQAAGLSEVYTTSACLGENALEAPEAAPTLPKEPLQYRLQEIIYVYGPTIKALVEEKFGAGIMSAIDFTMDIDKVADPKGDRVKITMNGKFLVYKKW